MKEKNSSNPSLQELIQKMSSAVRLKEIPKITHKIKEELEIMIRSGGITLPDHLMVPQDECYARRLVHEDPDLGYVIVAMTWGPGQSTPIHDHSGIWCVEGVISGEMHVTQYELLEKKNDLFHFGIAGQVKVGVGGTGTLIPPHEHHLLSNAQKDKSSVTLHVYGGEINQCSTFTEEKKGWYRRHVKKLSYHGSL